MYGYIYITTNLINGKQYIGLHKSEEFDKSYKGSGKYFLKALNKYGKDNFKTEILEECDSKEELSSKEKYWIDKFDAVNSDKFYNLSEGGYGLNRSGSSNPFYGKHHSEETRSNWSKIRKGRRSNNAGKRMINKNGISKFVNSSELESYIDEGWKLGSTEESKIRNSESSKGTVVSIETRRKISEALKGDNNPMKREDVRRKVSLKMKGRSISEESRRKISETLSEREFSVETRRKISEATSRSRSGTKLMNDGTKNKYVKLEEIDNHINKGWKLGKVR